MRLATCPLPADLEHLFLGGLPEQEVEGLEEHVLECNLCLQKLKKLFAAKETLAGVLRDETTSDVFSSSPVVQALMMKLEALPAVPGSAAHRETAMITFPCSACHKKLSVKADLAGKKARCPVCGQVVLVPGAVAALRGKENVQTLPPAPVDAGNPPTSPEVRELDATVAPHPGGTDRDTSLTDFLVPPQAKDELGRLGKYRILKILGHGGMGVVYQAEDLKLKRTVAIKAMLPKLAASANSGKRFLREAEAMAAVEHDHIVRIYQIDEDRGVPFFAMEFLKGQPLDARLARAPHLPLAEVLQIGREIAEALVAAHATGLIHRDIKPANIWLETPRNRVKLLDFGLARAASEDSGLTQQGTILGTPAYMAPEQARGGAVDNRCDLFSLGVVLYHLCTGKQPFRANDAMATLLAVAMHDPVAPLQLNSGLPRALSDLVMRLLAKDPAQRPASAEEVVQALRQLESDLATSSPDFTSILRTPALDRRRGSAGPRRGKRRPVTWMAVLLGVLALGAVAAGVVVYRIQTDHGELIISTDNPDVEIIARKNGQEVTILDTRTGKQFTLHAGAYDLELKDQKNGLKLEPGKVTIRRGETVLATITQTRKGPALAAKPELLYSLPWMDEQQRFPAHLWFTRISSDGRLFLAGGDTGPAGAIRVCNLATGRQVQALVLGGEPWFFSAQFLPGSKQLIASYSKMKDLYLWDIDSGTVVRTFAGHDEPSPDFAVSPDGKRLLSWNDDKTVRLWNVETGEELRKLEGHADKAAGVFSPDGTQVLTFSPDKTLRLWSVETGKELQKLGGHTDAPIGCFSPDGKQALSYGPDQTIRLWDLATGKEIRRYEGPTDKVNFAGFVADGRLVVGNSADQKFRVWETASGKLVREIDAAPYGGDYWTMTATADGRHALVNHANDSVRLLDLTTGKEIHCFDNCSKARGFSFSPDGTLVVAGSFRAGVYVLRLPAAAPGQRIDLGKARKTP